MEFNRSLMIIFYINFSRKENPSIFFLNTSGIIGKLGPECDLYWIGYNKFINANWTWIDDTSAPYINWMEGENSNKLF